MPQYRDYRPETRAVIEALVKAEFSLLAVHDGEDRYENPTVDKAVETICSVDEAHLYVRHHSHPRTLTLFFVLGNSPGELVADHHDVPVLNNVLAAVSDEWEGREQPMGNSEVDQLKALNAELVEELEALLNFAEEYGPSERASYEDWSGYFDTARAILAKAKGEQS